MPSEIAIPFRFGGDRRIVTVSDPDARVRQHVFSLINTDPNERPMVPGYGVDTLGLLFEDADPEEVGAMATTRIAAALAMWEPGVSLDGVGVIDDDETVNQIDVTYSRKDGADSGTAANANEAIVSANGSVREVVRG